MGRFGLKGCGECDKIIWWWQKELCYSSKEGANKFEGLVMHEKCAKNKHYANVKLNEKLKGGKR